MVGASSFNKGGKIWPIGIAGNSHEQIMTTVPTNTCQCVHILFEPESFTRSEIGRHHDDFTDRTTRQIGGLSDVIVDAGMGLDV